MQNHNRDHYTKSPIRKRIEKVINIKQNFKMQTIKI